MEKGKTATIRLEPVLQIGPPPDLVHGLIGHQLFEQCRRRFPGDSLELEKADVEPVGKQPPQVLFEAEEHGVALLEIKQFGATVDQEFYPFRERVELAQEGDAWRLQCSAQRPLGGRALVRSGGVDQCVAATVDFATVDIEFAGEQLQKTLAPLAVQRQISTPEIGRPSARSPRAAAPV